MGKTYFSREERLFEIAMDERKMFLKLLSHPNKEIKKKAAEILEDEQLKKKWKKLFKNLARITNERIVPEDTLIGDAKNEGIDLGKSGRTRLNYLIKLGIIPIPEGVYHGQGKGGGRLYHIDTLKILRFVDSLRQRNLSFNEIAQEVDSERLRRIEEEAEFIGFDETPIIKINPEVKRDLFNSILETKNFDNGSIRAILIFHKYNSIDHLLDLMLKEIESLERLNKKIAKKLCEKDKVVFIDEIKLRKKDKIACRKMLDDLYNQGEDLLKEIWPYKEGILKPILPDN